MIPNKCEIGDDGQHSSLHGNVVKMDMNSGKGTNRHSSRHLLCNSLKAHSYRSRGHPMASHHTLPAPLYHNTVFSKHSGINCTNTSPDTEPFHREQPGNAGQKSTLIILVHHVVVLGFLKSGQWTAPGQSCKQRRTSCSARHQTAMTATCT